MKIAKFGLRTLPLWQSLMLMGIIITITSQFYLRTFSDSSIRISASVILYPILLLALVDTDETPRAAVSTAGMVILVRLCLQLASNVSLVPALQSVLSGGCYYLIYALLFFGIRRMELHRELQYIVPALFLCDVIANLGELTISVLVKQDTPPNVALIYSFLGVAILRTAITTIILWWLGYYRKLLMQEEHEKRYQRLFLMTAQLKNEAYLLDKSTEQIETIMSRAYKLYENLSEEGHTDSDLALSITRDIHEVKKNSQRVLRGLEGGLDEMYDDEALSFSDLLHILLGSASTLPTDSHVTLTHTIHHNFTTKKHYQLASILRNLISNAVEAILSTSERGNVHVEQSQDGDNYRFTVVDDGPGMSQRGMQNIFNVGYSTKFNALTGDINRGVGLSTVQGLVEELGGTISVQSQVGVGSTFTVIIPKNSLEEDS